MSRQTVDRFRRSHFSGGVLTGRQQRRREAAARRRQAKKAKKARQGGRPKPEDPAIPEAHRTASERTEGTETTQPPPGGVKTC
jgi:hypothetical protein